MVRNKITLNVLANITKKVNNGGYIAPSNNILIVFNGSNIDINSRIIEIKKLQEKNFRLSIGFSFMGERILNRDEIIKNLNPINVYGEEDIFNLENIVEKHPKLIMPNITMNTLSKVALGMIDSFSSTILWTYLYYGKDVYLDFNSVNNYLGETTENKVIKGLINNHIKTIKNMGALEIKDGNYMENILEENELVKGNSNKDLIMDKKTKGNFNEVITERDLLQFSKDTVLKLPKGTIITPLAKDRARELGIKIEMER